MRQKFIINSFSYSDLSSLVQEPGSQSLHQLQLGAEPDRVLDVPLPTAGSEVRHLVSLRRLQPRRHRLLYLHPSGDQGEVSGGHGGPLLQTVLETWEGQIINLQHMISYIHKFVLI